MSFPAVSVIDMNSLSFSYDTNKCTTCKKPQSELPIPLKRCAKCQSQAYCSRECQKAEWKVHKKTCASTAGMPKGPAGTDGHHNAGFATANRLFGGGDELHKMSEKEVFIRLIDTFRMRMEDEYVFAQQNLGIYGEENPRPLFKEFLDLAEKREGLLPKWWGAEKRKECEKVAGRDPWADISCAVEKSDVIEHYKDAMMPMKLRILGEKIYGKGFM
jgi:splicing suppressor protein 51